MRNGDLIRIRLIADVVTGRLDVQAIAATLPELAADQPIKDASDDEDFEDMESYVENEEVAA
jgi:type I restriction enzyme S subunit